MNDPAPIRLINFLLVRFRYPAASVGLCIAVPLLTFFAITAEVFPGADNTFWVNPLEMTGLFILLSIMPAYLLMYKVAAVRSRNLILSNLAKLIDPSDFASVLRFPFAKYWPLAMLLGVVNALATNVGWSSLNFEVGQAGFLPSVVLVIGQVITWSTAGLILLLSIEAGLYLHRLGKLVKIDLYNLDSLNGFGVAALSDLLMVMGILALTVLQALDFELRWDNYVGAINVAIPAAVVLVVLPIWSVHRRIRATKIAHLEELNYEISVSERGLDNDSLLRLNALLSRREQVHGLRNWPMNLSIFSRLIFYVLIPPLAWAGAAFTEVFLDNVLGL